jgi:hypothetical protein
MDGYLGMQYIMEIRTLHLGCESKRQGAQKFQRERMIISYF